MNQYNSKSFEELRMEDYLKGNKGTSQPVIGLGQPQQQQQQQPAFSLSQPNMFGSTPAGSTSGGMFGSSGSSTASTPFGGGPSNSFGGFNVSSAPSTNPLGNTLSFGGGAPAATTPAFGGFGAAPSTTLGGNTAGGFAFGGAKPGTTGGLGGLGGGLNTTATGGFGSTLGGAFGTNSGTSSIFGSPGTAGGNKPAFGSPATATGGFTFGQAPSTTTGGFGSSFGSTTTPSFNISTPSTSTVSSLGFPSSNPGGGTSAFPSLGGFGQSNTTTAPSFGGFGTTQQQANTGGFGGFGGFGSTLSQPANNTANTGAPAFSFGGTGTNMFNTTGTTSGFGGFGQPQQQQQQSFFPFQQQQQQQQLPPPPPQPIYSTQAIAQKLDFLLKKKDDILPSSTTNAVGNVVASSASAAPAVSSVPSSFGGNSGLSSSLYGGSNGGNGMSSRRILPRGMRTKLVESSFNTMNDFMQSPSSTSSYAAITYPSSSSSSTSSNNSSKNLKLPMSIETIDDIQPPLSVSSLNTVGRSSSFPLAGGRSSSDSTADYRNDHLLPTKTPEKYSQQLSSPMVDSDRLTNASFLHSTGLTPHAATSVDTPYLSRSVGKKQLQQQGGSGSDNEESKKDNGKMQNPLLLSNVSKLRHSSPSRHTTSNHQNHNHNISCDYYDFYQKGYSTIPNLLTIRNEEECSSITNFTVIRPGYGKIEWLGNTDIRNLQLSKIITIQKREVFVYEDIPSPPIGEELNKPAKITLYNIFPKGMTAAPSSTVSGKKGLNTEEEEKAIQALIEKLQKFCISNDSHFLSYEKESGEWSFLVKHFSRYGFLEDDEDEMDAAEEVEAEVNQRNKENENLQQPQHHQQQQQQMSHPAERKKIDQHGGAAIFPSDEQKLQQQAFVSPLQNIEKLKSLLVIKKPSMMEAPMDTTTADERGMEEEKEEEKMVGISPFKRSSPTKMMRSPHHIHQHTSLSLPLINDFPSIASLLAPRSRSIGVPLSSTSSKAEQLFDSKLSSKQLYMMKSFRCGFSFSGKLAIPQTILTTASSSFSSTSGSHSAAKQFIQIKQLDPVLFGSTINNKDKTSEEEKVFLSSLLIYYSNLKNDLKLTKYQQFTLLLNQILSNPFFSTTIQEKQPIFSSSVELIHAIYGQLQLFPTNPIPSLFPMVGTNTTESVASFESESIQRRYQMIRTWLQRICSSSAAVFSSIKGSSTLTSSLVTNDIETLTKNLQEKSYYRTALIACQFGSDLSHLVLNQQLVNSFSRVSYRRFHNS
jgi:hypothetical protein